jgi:glycosyltransferase involved in cell wall biosynthesis
VRVAQVVTLASGSGAFGGPLSVAREQSIELARRGHDVTIIAGWDGSGVIDTGSADVEVRLCQVRRTVPGLGFSGLTAPGLLRALGPRAEPYDIVHIHLARDLITLSAGLHARRLRLPYVSQTHGMIGPDRRLRARLADAVAVRRVLRDALAVFALTEAERQALDVVVGTGARIEILRNGIALVGVRDSSVPAAPPDVLFCARLHPRKRISAFLDMATQLVGRGLNARFSVVGPDGGDEGLLRERLVALGLQRHVTYEGALPPSSVGARLRCAAVYVLPSFDEPFPMTVLEAMAQGTPVVLTDRCSIAGDLARRGAALVTDGSANQLAEAVAEILLNPARGAELASAGTAAIRDAYGIGAVADRLEEVYARAAVR